MDRCLKTRSISTGYNQVTIYDGPLQSGGKAIMALYELSCRVIVTGQEFRNLSRSSWILLQVKNNVRTTIITTYCTRVSGSSGGAYIQQLESLAIMKIQND